MAYCHRTSHHLPICQVAAFPKAIGAGLKANTQVLTIDTPKVSTTGPPPLNPAAARTIPELHAQAATPGGLSGSEGPDQKAGRRATSSE